MVFLILAIFLYSQNHWVKTTNISFTDNTLNATESNKIKNAMETYKIKNETETDKIRDNTKTDKIKNNMETNKIKIVQISDLHGNLLSKNNDKLVKQIKDQVADVIVVTGDFIDQKTKNLRDMASLMNRLNKLCPLIYIPGNHEYWLEDMSEWEKELSLFGLEMTQNRTKTIQIRNSSISILGLDEAAIAIGCEEQKNLFRNLSEKSGIKIVLSHYPENFAMMGESSYKNYLFNIQFSGHAHGGQIFIPFVGGLYAPGQGFLPKYYKGVYRSDNSSDPNLLSNNPVMVVNRGLGNSIIPQRIFNRPEIIVTTINVN